MVKRSISKRSGNAPAALIHKSLPEELVAGYKAYREGRFPCERRRYLGLAHGQHPRTLMIGCVDSRVPLEIIFDADPGDLFVVRNISALVPPFASTGPVGTSAAIEYAVCALKVAHIVIVGHATCGGVRGYAETQTSDPPSHGLPKDGFVSRWIQLIKPAADNLRLPTPQHDPELAAYCEILCQEVIRQGLVTLRTYPWAKEAEDKGKLSLHGAYFGIRAGEISALDQRSGEFVPIP